MGIKLVEYFNKAKEIDGLSSQMKLAMITKMSSSQASSAPDSPDNLKKFEAAFSQLS